MERLKYGGDRVIKYLKRLFNKIELGEDPPTEWNMSYIFIRRAIKRCAQIIEVSVLYRL